jgi:16S rRNA (uracil1498-N3)-methyltransferase
VYMKVHRFMCELERVGTMMAITKPELIFQIHTVLRLEPNEKIIVTDGKGKVTVCKIMSTSPHIIEVLELSIHHEDIHQTPRLHAFLAVLKKDNFELAAQKMTEIGITDVTPIITDRTIKKGLDRERLERIIKEAVEQSGQSVLPTVHDELDFDQAIYEAVRDYGHIVCFEEDADPTPNPLPKGEGVKYKNTSLAFFVGPEGGWTPNELELFTREKAIRVSLGDTTLRGETAAILGAYVVKRMQKFDR